MKQYRFKEAKPLISFIEKHKTEIIGHTLKGLYIEYWPGKGRYSMSDLPVVIEMDSYYIVINYVVLSDLKITICREAEEIERCAGVILNIKNEVVDYYCEEFNLGEEKELIENRMVKDIKIERFSDEFECNIKGEIRPEGGDYFSSIRIFLDSGKTLCFCGADSICDGYIEAWCE